MKFYLIPLLLLVSTTSAAQTFFVDGSDPKSTMHVQEKVKFEGYRISIDSTQADFIIKLLLDGHYKFVSLKQPYKGYIKINKVSTGKEVGRTKLLKGGPTAFNGYNAAYGIFSKISDKYLKQLLLKCADRMK